MDDLCLVTRQVTRRGVFLYGNDYCHLNLVPWFHKRVRVCVDPVNADLALVFDPFTGFFICRAHKMGGIRKDPAVAECRASSKINQN